MYLFLLSNIAVPNVVMQHNPPLYSVHSFYLEMFLLNVQGLIHSSWEIADDED